VLARDHTNLPATHTRTVPVYFAAAEHHRPFAGTHCAYLRKDSQAELTSVAWLSTETRFGRWELCVFVSSITLEISDWSVQNC